MTRSMRSLSKSAARMKSPPPPARLLSRRGRSKHRPLPSLSELTWLGFGLG